MKAFPMFALATVVSSPRVDPSPSWIVPLNPDPFPIVPTTPGPLRNPPLPRTVTSAADAPLRASTPPEPTSIVLKVTEATCAGECHVPEHSDQFEFVRYLRKVTGPGHELSED